MAGRCGLLESCDLHIRSLNYVLDQLKPYTLYTVGVAGVTRGPEGIFSEVNGRTHGDGKGSS